MVVVGASAPLPLHNISNISAFRMLASFTRQLAARRQGATLRRRLEGTVDRPRSGADRSGFSLELITTIAERRAYWAKRELNAKGAASDQPRRNYRTTQQVQDLAISLYRDDSEIEGDSRRTWAPQRGGPLPRVLARGSQHELVATLSEQIRHTLSDWAPEHIAVLAPAKAPLLAVATHLDQLGVPAASLGPVNMQALLRPGAVRLVTIHAVKGLNLSVVYLVSGPVPGRAQMSATRQRRARWYVGVTRSAHTLSSAAVVPQAPAALALLARDRSRLAGPASSRWPEAT